MKDVKEHVEPENHGQSRFNLEVSAAIREANKSPLSSAQLLPAVTVTTSVTRVPHKLGRTPSGWFPVNCTAAPPWQSQAADSKYLYLIAAASVTCRVVVF